MAKKKKRGVATVQVVVILISLAILGMSFYAINTMKEATDTVAEAAISSGQQVKTQTGTVTTEAKVSCPSDMTTNGQVRYEDTLASTTTYGNPTCYFMPLSEGETRVTSGTVQTDGTYSTAVDLKCSPAGTKWKAVCVTKQGGAGAGYTSAEGTEFTAAESAAKVDLKGKMSDGLKVRVEDKYTGGAKYFNVTSCSVGGTTTNYVTILNSTGNCFIENDATITGTSLTLGTDEYIDARIYVKTNQTKRQFGEDGLRTFFLVDADGSDWSEPIVSMNGGPKLSNVITELKPEDTRKYSGYEYAYEISPIDDKENYIDFYLQSAAGVNPSGDPIIEFCAEGRYNSNKKQDTINIGCWTDAASQAQVSVAQRQYLKFIVS